MRFSKLSDKTLLNSFQEASKLHLSPDFIKLLEKEINERGLNKPNFLKEQLKKIN